MNGKSIGSALTALCLALSGPVFAQKEGDNPMHSFGRTGGNPHPPSVARVGDGQNTPADSPQSRNTQRRDNRPAYDNNRRDNRGDYRGNSGYRGNNDYRGNNNYRGNNDYRGGPGYHGGARGAGPDHAFYRGQRLPPQYRSHQYVVDDWRGHHLNAPPRGYQWVQTGGDYVLVAIATGIIASLLLNN